MKLTNRIFRGIIALKNKQIKLERERSRGYKETNDILSAYLALLVERHDGVRVPKELIREAIGSYRAIVGTAGDDYVITVERCGAYAEANNEVSVKFADSEAAEANDEVSAKAHGTDGEN